ncbi:MAG: undecaprenyl-diphosphate phosphatase [Bacteroidota bacterium]
MDWLQALFLGLLQGLTEFLPVSSSGHLELGKVLLNIENADDVTFTIAVHGATVLSTLVVFWKEILNLLKGSLKFRMNEETHYVLKLIVSMVPVLFVGIFLKDWVEGFFTGNLVFVGSMLLLTAVLLGLASFIRPKVTKPVTYKSALIMGLAQAVATLPGLSRSGSTIATGLMLGTDKKEVARFSFLMVLVPVIGANLIELLDMQSGAVTGGVGVSNLVIGFLAAFLSGLLACSWMINLVKKGKLIWFAIYCVIIGALAIGFGL